MAGPLVTPRLTGKIQSSGAQPWKAMPSGHMTALRAAAAGQAAQARDGAIHGRQRAWAPKCASCGSGLGDAGFAACLVQLADTSGKQCQLHSPYLLQLGAAMVAAVHESGWFSCHMLLRPA